MVFFSIPPQQPDVALESSLLDLGIHLLTVGTAAILSIISFQAYRKQREQRFAMISAGFAVFFLKELLVLINVFSLSSSSMTLLVHTLNLLILGLFFYGVIR